jgi:hypothetical protein
MWSRVVEVMLGCWLLISPFLFAHPAEEISWWITDMAAGLVVIVCALASYWPPTRHAHLLTLLVAAALIGFAYQSAGQDAVPSAHQNEGILGLLLMMFAVIPNEATRPPQSWENSRRRERAET